MWLIDGNFDIGCEERRILSGSCSVAPGSHWVSINIVIGKQQDTGATARLQLQPVRGQVTAPPLNKGPLAQTD